MFYYHSTHHVLACCRPSNAILKDLVTGHVRTLEPNRLRSLSLLVTFDDTLLVASQYAITWYLIPGTSKWHWSLPKACKMVHSLSSKDAVTVCETIRKGLQVLTDQDHTRLWPKGTNRKFALPKKVKKLIATTGEPCTIKTPSSTLHIYHPQHKE